MNAGLESKSDITFSLASALECASAGNAGTTSRTDAMAARIHKVQHDQRTKDGIRATQYLKFLESVALGKKRKLSPQTATRIAAAKVALPFLIPTLQSVEATVHDERDNADPMALYSQMIAALAANPALLDRLIAAVHAHRATNAQLVTDAGTQQSGK